MKHICFCVCVSCFLTIRPATASVRHWELRPEPFTSTTNFMSLPGYYRFKQYQETGIWQSLKYDFTPVEESVHCPGDDPSLGRLEAINKFEKLLKEYPNRVLFVIRWMCQAPEPGEGPMRDWHFSIYGNRFLDATPQGNLKPNVKEELGTGIFNPPLAPQKTF
jgi:hypothetical protein